MKDDEVKEKSLTHIDKVSGVFSRSTAETFSDNGYFLYGCSISRTGLIYDHLKIDEVLSEVTEKQTHKRLKNK